MRTDRVIDKGAHFYRCDFQVHSPRDAQWKGPRPKSQAEREAYANAFVAKCREIGLQAVAITDHHDLVYAPLIRAAAESELDAQGAPIPNGDRLVVFPGVELTLGVPCQALLILDATLPDDRLAQVLDALPAAQHNVDDHTLPSVTRLDHISSLRELYDTLDQRDWLRGRYIVLPNVTDNGHGTLMRTGMQAKYKEMPCVGGYLDGSVSSIGTGNAVKFAGKDSAWGSKPIALFQTSDSRNATFETLGKHSTWVKWATPTAEALRQACLSHQSRVAQTAPGLPNVYISRIIVSNSKFLGHIDISFNPQYNAIIGGRGTGKSTILEYLRWALCDQVLDFTDDEMASPSVRRRNLIAATLEPVSGQVEIFFTINDIPHIVRRDAASDEVLLKVGDEEFSRAREADIRALLPIHAYSQKQLSGVSLRVEELTRFVNAPIKTRLEEFDREIGELAGRLRENYGSLQRARSLDANIARSVLLEKSLSEQATNLRSALTGLAESDRTVLDSKPAVDRARDRAATIAREVARTTTAGSTFAATIEETIGELSASDFTNEIQPAADAALDQTVEALTALRETVASALARFNEAIAQGSEQAQALARFNEAIANYDLIYEDVKQRSSAHEARLAELAELESRRKSANDLALRQQRERRELGDPQATHVALREQLVRMYSLRSELLTAECENLTKLSSGMLRATLNRGRGFAEVAAKFRNLIQGSNVRGAKIDTLFAELQTQSDPLTAWEAAVGELELLLLLGDNGDHSSESTPTLTRLGLTVPDQRKIRSRMTPEGWLDLALTPLVDEPTFEYRTKEKEYIAFSAASAGQQATALLRVLLAQTGMPLVIDQPEEDLDSQVVQEVVERIWQAKQGRQLIFASHNANLVVNGDAELVVVCDYRRVGDQSGGRIKREGAIDVAEVRDEITHIMEGGERAFRLRKEKYGF